MKLFDQSCGFHRTDLIVRCLTNFLF